MSEQKRWLRLPFFFGSDAGKKNKLSPGKAEKTEKDNALIPSIMPAPA